MYEFRYKRSPDFTHLTGTGLPWQLGSLCQLHHIPFGPLQIERQLPPRCTIATSHNPMHALDFYTGDHVMPLEAVELSKLTLPGAGFSVARQRER